MIGHFDSIANNGCLLSSKAAMMQSSLFYNLELMLINDLKWSLFTFVYFSYFSDKSTVGPADGN